MTAVRSLRIAASLVLLGLLLALLAQLVLTPGTFLTFVVVGLPCLVAGAVLFLVHVYRRLRRKDAL